MKSLKLSAAFAIALAFGQAAVAQTQAELVAAFSGEWFVFEPSQSAGTNPCQITLSPDSADTAPMLNAVSIGCAAGLSGLTTWNVENGRLVFFAADGMRMAELGGTQRRLTGTLEPGDQGIVAERSNGDGSNVALANAIQRHRCFYLGLTDDCATEADLAAPTFNDEDPPLASVETLGKLVARSQPRRDAPEAGRIPQGTCVRVNQCIVATDGTWCRARFGDVSVWLARNAVRQNEWPILTYRNGCTPAEADAAAASEAETETEAAD